MTIFQTRISYKFLLISAATIECLLKELKREPRLCSMYDELNTWLGSINGIYKSGSSDYDRSFYQSLYNSPCVLKRQTCKGELRYSEIICISNFAFIIRFIYSNVNTVHMLTCVYMLFDCTFFLFQKTSLSDIPALTSVVCRTLVV